MHFEFEWDEWRLKFEELLKKLYFYDATVHIKTSYMDLATAIWDANWMKYDFSQSILPELSNETDWKYEPSFIDGMFANRK